MESPISYMRATYWNFLKDSAGQTASPCNRNCLGALICDLHTLKAGQDLGGSELGFSREQIPQQGCSSSCLFGMGSQKTSIGQRWRGTGVGRQPAGGSCHVTTVGAWWRGLKPAGHHREPVLDTSPALVRVRGWGCFPPVTHRAGWLVGAGGALR